jgi:PAP2 superfamily
LARRQHRHPDRNAGLRDDHGIVVSADGQSARGRVVRHGDLPFPSIQVAVAIFYVLFGWQFGRLAPVASILFLIAIMVGSVHLGWHYALDGYAAMAGAAAIYFAVGRAQRRLGTMVAAPPALTTQPLPA